eukprot:TRINITY_DN23521_c0_g1_i9.p1 TRINITY_DN23521_c0_g1~~TRINITY_DN23521_c0_g1_i9.p1  ORF type:complete len:171 (+),score=20.51 TRINITY_DN23521_c0_g1_i9:145-657(+)
MGIIFNTAREDKLTWEANEIIPGLFVGSEDSARDFKSLKAAGVTHVLNVANDVKNFFPEEFVYKRLDVKDFGADEGISRVFKNAFDFIHGALADPKAKVLVHCFAGQNRSVTIAVAYIMQLQKKSLKEAYQLVKSKRAKAGPFQDNRKQLIEYEKKERGEFTMTPMDDAW